MSLFGEQILEVGESGIFGWDGDSIRNRFPTKVVTTNSGGRGGGGGGGGREGGRGDDG